MVAAVIHDGSRILATQRGYGEFKDKWEFPGGKMEAGESREEAHCYLCSVVSGTLVLKEHESARWLPAEALESVDWLLADLQILPIIRQNL